MSKSAEIAGEPLPLNADGSILSCSKVSKGYREGQHQIDVLRQLSLRVMPGERIAIMGASGAGKSTLLNLLGGLDSPDSGEISLCGERLSVLDSAKRAELRNLRLGFVFQFHHLLREFNALENIAMPLLIRGTASAAARSAAGEWLERVGLSARASHRPAQLSGGERQRVAIARSLVANPACVLFDEPTGNLDQDNAARFTELIKELNAKSSAAFVVVTHNAALAAAMSRQFKLDQGVLRPCSNP